MGFFFLYERFPQGKVSISRWDKQLMDPLEPQEMKLKNTNFCPKGTHIQMKSFSPKEISCFFKYPLLVAFRNVKGRLGEMP